VAKYFKISIGELLSLSANGLQSQTKETEIRVGGGGVTLGCDDVETDQVVAIAARTTIADAAMILRMKSIAFPVGSTECDRPSACSMSGSLCAGRFKRCDGHHRMFDRRPPAVTLELVTGGATISRRAQHGPPPQDLPDPVDGHSSRPWRRDSAAMRRYEL
jgi:hypothetical protein